MVHPKVQTESRAEITTLTLLNLYVMNKGF